MFNYSHLCICNRSINMPLCFINGLKNKLLYCLYRFFSILFISFSIQFLCLFSLPTFSLHFHSSSISNFSIFPLSNLVVCCLSLASHFSYSTFSLYFLFLSSYSVSLVSHSLSSFFDSIFLLYFLTKISFHQTSRFSQNILTSLSYSAFSIYILTLFS